MYRLLVEDRLFTECCAAPPRGGEAETPVVKGCEVSAVMLPESGGVYVLHGGQADHGHVQSCLLQTTQRWGIAAHDCTRSPSDPHETCRIHGGLRSYRYIANTISSSPKIQTVTYLISCTVVNVYLALVSFLDQFII